MAKVDPQKLNELINSAGIGSRTAKKLRAANGVEAPKPRGQGAARMPEFSDV
jgi:hypothetical protein